MTQEQLKHAAQMLLNTKQLTGGDEPKYLPKIYIVNGHCYLFLNVARRATNAPTPHPRSTCRRHCLTIIKSKRYVFY